MPEWSNGAVSKTVERIAFQGFESLSLRKLSVNLENVVRNDDIFFVFYKLLFIFAIYNIFCNFNYISV